MSPYLFALIIFVLLPPCTPLATPYKPHVLIAPAQFLVPADYASLCLTLVSDHGFPSARCAPLTRLDWLRVVPSSPPGKFIRGDLDPKESLVWYYEALEQGISSILSEAASSPSCACCPPLSASSTSSSTSAPTSVAILGHSIGGWVSSSYLTLSPLRTSISSLIRDPDSPLKVTSLTTLGSPMRLAEKGLVDQTRGLLGKVEKAGLPEGVQVKSVCGDAGLKGLPGLVAGLGYWSLTGSLGGVGDGIVPMEIADMMGEVDKVVKGVSHAGHLPTPYKVWSDEGSIPLPDVKWYGDCIEEWVDFVV